MLKLSALAMVSKSFATFYPAVLKAGFILWGKAIS
jgi:hypothetical protein